MNEEIKLKNGKLNILNIPNILKSFVKQYNLKYKSN